MKTFKDQKPIWHRRLLTHQNFAVSKHMMRTRPGETREGRQLKQQGTKRRQNELFQDRREYEAAFLDDGVWKAAKMTVDPIGKRMP